MWELDIKESWAPKNWCFWTVVLEKTLESPLDCKEIQPVNPKGNQPWIFIGRTDAEAETPAHLIQRTDSLEKILMLGKIEGRRRSRWQSMRWMVSLIQWTWVWACLGRQFRTGKSSMLQSVRSQRFGHNLVTEQQNYSNLFSNNIILWGIMYLLCMNIYTIAIVNNNSYLLI